MKTKSVSALTRSMVVVTTLLSLALACVLTGCATRRDVTEIVAQSNAATLAGQFGLPSPGPNSKQQPWQEASDRIDVFIDAHPGQPALTAPLRIRQALLLLNNRQFSLAEAAFTSAKLDDLHTDRDKALKRSQETLLWWFANSTNDTWSATDQSRAQEALQQLKKEQSELAQSPDIRDYLAEMRAWIGLSAAKQTTSADKAREHIEDALNVYAETFTPKDLEKLAAREEELPDPSAFAPDVRRRLRARSVLAFARKVNKDDNLRAHPTTALFDRTINE